jgi:uncharacterized protein (DUF58 family)
MAVAADLRASGRRRLRALLDRWLRHRTRLDLPLTLGYRQIFILPTRFGWLLGVLMGAMLIGSLNFNNNLGLLTTFTVAGACLNAMLLAFRNLRGLEIVRGGAAPVHAGEPVIYRLTVTAPADRDREGLQVQSHEAASIEDVPAGRSREIDVDLGGFPRGWHRPGRLRIATSHPVGLFRAWSWLEPSAPFLVWPRPAPNPPPLPEYGDSRHGRRQHPREEGEEFHSLRRWREGDPIHRIAWKASQRHGTLLSREFRREQARHVTLDLNRASGSDLEDRIAVVTAWVLEAARSGREWTLRLPTSTVGPGRGDAHKHDCLRALAEL